MTDAEWRAFLSEGARTGKLATTRTDGRPHVVPIWFVLDGEDLVFTTGVETVKGRALRRDGRAAICVDDERPPFAYVMVEGRAEIGDDPDELLRFATAIGGRYMGDERAEEFGRRNAVESEVLVRLRPDHVVAVRNVSD